MPSTSLGSPKSLGTGIIGAFVGKETIEAVIEIMHSKPDDWTQYRFVRFGHDGKLTENVLIIEKDNVLQNGFKTVMLRGQFRFGWIEAGKGILLASIKQGKVNVETLLASDSMGKEGATISNFWIVETKGQSRLFVAWYRYVYPDGKPLVGGKQYTWLYSYLLAKDGPKLLGKVCVEGEEFVVDDEIRLSDMVCAANGDDVVVWQTVGRRTVGGSIEMAGIEGRIQMIRFALWKKEGKLDWKYRYTGNAWIACLVDPSCGAVFLVKESKNPENASGILCGLRTDPAKASPVGTFGSKMHVRFARLANLNRWVIACGEPKGVRIVVLDNDLVSGAKIKVDGADIRNFFLATRLDSAYLFLLQHGKLSCKKLGKNQLCPK